ncbi:MAG TPA: aconitase X catalytic domain-containing protein [Anaerolineae bacterium]|nr:aconitase X catalytic domain-containing protein [Anaerolineae bacterium]
MKLTPEEQHMLDGTRGRATQKAMEILVALGTIYGAERMVSVTSVQIAGVSYDNLGEAGLHWLSEMADGGGKTRVLTTLNPAGMDIENWQALGIDEDFARQQMRIIDTFARMNVVTTCSCTPYLIGNSPHFGQHIAWSESSAVCYANSVIGARSNREGGPSALAAALTGVTPEYGLHLEENRRPGVTIHVEAQLPNNNDFGTLGVVIGKRLEQFKEKPIAHITGVDQASVENLKSFCASVATYGGAALFHMRGITPEADRYAAPDETIVITQTDLEEAQQSLISAETAEADFVSLGCPHLTLNEIARIAALLEGKRVTKEFWITTARPIKQMADRMGYTRIIEAAGAKFAADTCCVVAPIKGRFKVLITDSAKACYYAAGKNKFKTIILPFDEVVLAAVE